MTVLISKATGNLTAAATWGVVDASSLLDSETNNVVVSTSANTTNTASFTPGAIEIDGIAIKLYKRAATPVGTITIKLYNITDGEDVDGTPVTINVADLPNADASISAGADQDKSGGWIFFKFADAVLLEAAHDYRVNLLTSNANQVWCWRNATANNFSRMLRTTTTGAPAAGDVMHVMGEHTGAGTGNDIVVTMDSVADTDYGVGTNGIAALTISKRGTLSYGVEATTNYYLKLSGDLHIYNSGTFNVGTVANPIPRDSIAVLEFDPTADGGMGLIVWNGSVCTLQGLSRTVGKNVVSCLLNTDEGVNQTELGVDTDTGWLDNDVICIASTSRTYSECEKGAMNGDAAAAALTVDGFGGVAGGLAYAHSGTSPTQAEIINLTRNVKFRSATSTLMTYACFKATAVVDIDWVEFYYIGTASDGKKGLTLEITTGSLDMHYCSIHDCEYYGIGVTDGISFNNITISYLVTWNCASVSGSTIFLDQSNADYTTWEFSHSILMYCVKLNAYLLYLKTVQGNIHNITVVGANGVGIILTSSLEIGTLSNITSHSNATKGIVIDLVVSQDYRTLAIGKTISNVKSYRNSDTGVDLGTLSTQLRPLIIDGLEVFGNYIKNINFQGTMTELVGIDWVLSGDSTFATQYGFDAASAGAVIREGRFYNCTFGVAAGIKVAHTVADIHFYTPWNVRHIFHNCLFASVTTVYPYPESGLTPGAYMKSQKHNQTAGLIKSWFKFGIIENDDTYYYPAVTGSPSQKITPQSTVNKIESGQKRVAIANGDTCTPHVWVRKSSVASGGADYNGNQPRLILKANPAAGITADVVLDTMSGGLDTWEELTAVIPSAVTDNAVLEFVVDCDGNAGFINVDNWSVE